MNDLFRNLLKDVSLIILTASLLVLSLPNANIYIFAWVGLVPLLIAIREKQPLKAFALSQACGMMFFMGIFHWIFQISGYTYIHHACWPFIWVLMLECSDWLSASYPRRWGLTLAWFPRPLFGFLSNTCDPICFFWPFRGGFWHSSAQ
jgi:apolipoprotein N-acyltransferase